MGKPDLRKILVVYLLLFTIVLIYEYKSNVSDSNFVSFRAPKICTVPLSLHCNLGRLGNQMCTYAALYGLSKLNGRRFLPLSCNTLRLKDIFEGPRQVESIESPKDVPKDAWKISSFLKPEDSEIPSNSTFIAGYFYPCSYTFFDHWREDILREFQFHEHLQSHAQDVLREANVRNLSIVTYVGLHVRRGDYKKRWLDAYEGVPVNMEYFRTAVKYFRDKYENVIFVGISDDRPWITRELSADFGVHVPKEAPSPAHDLAVLASCNHTIMTYGTFGFWGAYLAGGEVVYFDKFLKPNTTFMLEKFRFDKMYPPHWKGIVTVNSSYWSSDTDTTTHTAVSSHRRRRDK